MPEHLLARFAENVFWLARYIERTENLARILDVNESFARDRHGEHDWLPVVQIIADEKSFFARFDKATAQAVIAFYVADRDNPASIVSALRVARENASTLRHLISTEMWQQLNVFYNRIAALRRRDLALANLSRLCQIIKEGCQTHTGITEGTLYRDEAWCFYQIGRNLERADQTSRLLDIKYLHLTESAEAPGAPVDISQWNAILRSAAGYHAFRRTNPRGLEPTQVAAFLMYQKEFPRSMAACVGRVGDAFETLETGHELRPGRETKTVLRELLAFRRRKSRARIQREVADLHSVVDRFQFQLAALADGMGRDFFGYGR